MTSMRQKVGHVRCEGQTRDHECHWPGCKKQVPPAKWGCRGHWYQLPKDIRAAIWAAYCPGQEAGQVQVSAVYVSAARAAQDWIAAFEREKASKALQAPPAPAQGALF